MDQTHRDILKKKRVDIVDNIANPHEVVDALFAGGILTDDLKEQIQVKLFGPRQANSRSLARTSAARSYKQ